MRGPMRGPMRGLLCPLSGLMCPPPPFALWCHERGKSKGQQSGSPQPPPPTLKTGQNHPMDGLGVFVEP